jgi:DICT domain-containing protein
MVSIQLYVVETAEQARQAELLDLAEFTPDDTQCENCDVAVGFVNNRFASCVICVEEDDDVWIVCAECAGGVLLTE